MRTDIFEGLPTSLQALVREIEGYVGFEIQVLSRSDRELGSEIHETSEIAVGNITSFDAAIIEYYGELRNVRAEDYAHELLHMHRAYLQNIPHLYPKKVRNGSTASGLDNWLEHVVIYERQLELCPGFEHELTQGLTKFWNECPWHVADHALRFNLISRYMITHLYAGREAKAAMKAAILANGLGGVRAPARRALAALRDKKTFVRRVFEFCQIPTRLFYLRHHDIRNRRNSWYEF